MLHSSRFGPLNKSEWLIVFKHFIPLTFPPTLKVFSSFFGAAAPSLRRNLTPRCQPLHSEWKRL